MGVKVNWHGDNVKREVNKRGVDLITKLVIMGEGKTKENITDLGRIDTGLMRNSMTHEVDAPTLTGRFGNNIFYTVFQEMGTSRGIRPGFFLRGAMEWLKTQVGKLVIR